MHPKTWDRLQTICRLYNEGERDRDAVARQLVDRAIAGERGWPRWTPERARETVDGVFALFQGGSAA